MMHLANAVKLFVIIPWFVLEYRYNQGPRALFEIITGRGGGYTGETQWADSHEAGLLGAILLKRGFKSVLFAFMHSVASLAFLSMGGGGGQSSLLSSTLKNMGGHVHLSPTLTRPMSATNRNMQFRA